MSLINKDARRKLVRTISGPPLVWLIYLVIKALRTTMRIEVRGGGVMADFVDRGEGFVGAFWHGRLLMIPPLYPGQRMHVLIGTHRDGQLIADVRARRRRRRRVRKGRPGRQLSRRIRGGRR